MIKLLENARTTSFPQILCKSYAEQEGNSLASGLLQKDTATRTLTDTEVSSYLPPEAHFFSVF